MGDSQQPKPAVPQFEVPDLELEPVLRPARAAAAPTPAAPSAPARDYSAPNLFDDDAFIGGSSTIDLGIAGEGQGAAHIGTAVNFGTLGNFELEGNDSGLALEPVARQRAASAATPAETSNPWPSGQPPARDRIAVDPLELALLAGYGEAPKSVYLTPAYAYRVFSRQRELKSILAPLEAERTRTEAERESTLAELARAVRPDAERVEQFRRLLAPLIELEQLGNQRGEALSSVNAELAAQTKALDSELATLATQLEAERARELEAERIFDEREATAKRADAKLKRVHIEMRAVQNVAEQKLGPQGGIIPEPEASQLAALKERAHAVQPEVDQAKAELEQAKAALDHASARVTAVRQSERLSGRKKQALVQHYQAEISARGRGLDESSQQQHAALVDLARALLAARGAVAVPESHLERVRSAGQRADALLTKCELHLRALDAYDRPKVAQGVKLACTFAALFVFLIVLKLAL